MRSNTTRATDSSWAEARLLYVVLRLFEHKDHWERATRLFAAVLPEPLQKLEDQPADQRGHVLQHLGCKEAQIQNDHVGPKLACADPVIERHLPVRDFILYGQLAVQTSRGPEAQEVAQKGRENMCCIWIVIEEKSKSGVFKEPLDPKEHRSACVSDTSRVSGLGLFAHSGIERTPQEVAPLEIHWLVGRDCAQRSINRVRIFAEKRDNRL